LLGLGLLPALEGLAGQAVEWELERDFVGGEQVPESLLAEVKQAVEQVDCLPEALPLTGLERDFVGGKQAEE
jgi:hypothetical protein